MSDLFLAALAGFLLGAFLAAVGILTAHKKVTRAKLASVTRLLFLAISLSALAWVFISYAIAIYATVHLQQVYTMAELSDPAIRLILFTLFGKIVENLFEHNDGALFGHRHYVRKCSPAPSAPPHPAGW